MKYKKFKISELFTSLSNGKANSLILSEGNDCPYIGAKKSSNGIMQYCAYDANLVQQGNCIIFICNGAGSVGYSLYFDRPFIATSDVVIGYAPFLNREIGLYLVTLLDLERPKYSYGRKWKRYLRNTTISLPVNSDNQPDWDYIETFIKNYIYPKLPSRAHKIMIDNIDYSPLNSHLVSLSNPSSWKWFRLGNIINRPYKAKAYNAQDLTFTSADNSNAIKYITRTDENNGVKGFVENDNFVDVEDGNAITIGDTTATIYYQENQFICGDHIVVLRYPKINKFNALFLVSILNLERFRYSYGKSFKMDSINNTKIKLPSDNEGNPDWEYMENYIKSLPFSSNL